MPMSVLRVALAIGFCIDFFVGLLCVAAQPLLQPLLDIPVRDPAVTTIAGGELLVAAAIYAFVFASPRRWQPLLWLCAFDQLLGVLLPAIEIARGHAPATVKTLGPMPFQLILAGIYIAGARFVPRRMIDAPLDHVAIVVADLEASIALYTQTLGFSQVYREILADQGVEAVGLRTGDSVIELLRPLDENSPIAKFRGSAESKLHHTAYRVPDVAAELARLKAGGMRLIDERPRPGAHGNTIAFIHPRSTGGVLIELCQR